MSTSSQFPADVLVVAAVYHNSATAGKQSYAGTADTTVFGGMLPLSQKARTLLGGDLSLTHLLMTDIDSDIREGDKVIITSGKPVAANTAFRVAHVDSHVYGSLPHKEAVLSQVET